LRAGNRAAVWQSGMPHFPIEEGGMIPPHASNVST